MQLKKLFAALAVSGGLVFTLAGCGDKAPAEKTAAPAQTAAVELKPENRGIYTQSDSPKKSSRNIWSLAVVSVDQRY